ncbi:MAG: hypothetical protein ACUVS7_01650 [Bryobacteraceae bacterium]
MKPMNPSTLPTTDLSKVPFMPSSIPHFLHWDLAYLWMLTAGADQVPPSWKEKLGQWRNLLLAFFAGKLEIHWHEIESRLQPWLQPFGICALQLLRLDGKVVGLLSPVVLVRPLPDASSTVPTLSPTDLAHARKALRLTRDEIEAGFPVGQIPPHVTTLIRILDRVIDSVPPADSHKPFCTISVPIFQQLPSLTAFASDPSPQVELLQCQLHYCDKSAPSLDIYVPRCSSCGKELTVERNGAVIPVVDDTVRLKCHKCAKTTDVELSRFFLWRRRSKNGSIEVVVWKDREGLKREANEVRYPPPHLLEQSGDQTVVTFEWNASLVMDSRRRWLRLSFNCPVREASVWDDLFYSRYLALGNEQNAVGFPYRSAWLDAADISDASSEGIEKGIRFQNLGVRGLPFKLSLLYSESLQRRPGCGVAIYPGPEIHSKWRKRRIFLAGVDAGECRLRAEGTVLVEKAQAIECEGYPDAFSVEMNEDGKCGVSFFLKPAARPEPAKGSLFLGLDFGTTNSVLYFSQNPEQPLQTKESAFLPAEIHHRIYWLAKPSPMEEEWWLPSPGSSHRGDPYLVPSALWNSDPRSFIRWHECGPPGFPNAVSGFKWDSGLADLTPKRVAFLEELLFWALPVILHRLGGSDQPTPVMVSVGYPLAFSYDQRKQMTETLKGLTARVRENFGHELHFYRIDESRAAMKSLGAADVGTLTLVADLGGRTLDVVLFRVKSHDEAPEILQVGSVDLGGELFVDALSREEPGNCWKYRDAIRRGDAMLELRNQNRWRDLLNRLLRLALEFVRTMAAAHQNSTNKREPIRLLLIGNGWRLLDIYASGKDPRVAFLQWAKSRAVKFDASGLEVCEDVLDGILSPKHYVAVGALKHAMQGGESSGRSSEESVGTRLPAGRRVEFKGSGDVWEWYDMTGDNGKSFNSSASHNQGQITIDLASVPALQDRWKQEISSFLEDLPPENLMREWILASVKSDFLLKGPLQLLIENHWKHKIA